MEIILVIVSIAVIVLLFKEYQALKKLRKQIKHVWYTMDWCMNQKYRVLLSILEVCKYFMDGKRDFVKEFSDSIKSIKRNNKLDEKFKADVALDNKVNTLFMLLKSKPELMKLQEYQSYINKFEDIENRNKKASNSYSQIVNFYNQKIHNFPTRLVALLFGFKRYPTKRDVAKA